MDPSAMFASVIDSVMAATPPDAGTAEAAMARVVGSAQGGQVPPLFNVAQQAFVLAYVLPRLHVLIVSVEMQRRIALTSDAGSADVAYYAPEKPGGKQIGVEVLASRYYHDHDFTDMPIRVYGTNGGNIYHCAELVWNSAILAGFHVPMNKNAKVPGYYGFYNSANVLYDQCEHGLAEVASPNAADSFKAATVFTDARGKAIGLPGPRVGDLILGRRKANDAGERAPGHLALLSDMSTAPPTFLQAGVTVGSGAYALTPSGINDDHDARLIRPRSPDWTRIERWLAEGSAPKEFARYFKASYPSSVAENSYRGLFTLAVSQAAIAIDAEAGPAAQNAKALVKQLQDMLAPKP